MLCRILTLLFFDFRTPSTSSMSPGPQLDLNPGGGPYIPGGTITGEQAIKNSIIFQLTLQIYHRLEGGKHNTH